MPKLSELDLTGSWVDIETNAIEQLPNINVKELPFNILRKDIRDECYKSQNGEGTKL